MVGLEFLFIRLMVHAVQDNIITLGLFIAFQTYVLRLFHDLMFISNDLKRFFAAIGEAGEMIEILETEHEVVDYTSESLVIEGGQVTFDAVDFDYGE
jgi:ABC-type transport system involved in Fe-S cluster assembly fused permease/ATPase subunit